MIRIDTPSMVKSHAALLLYVTPEMRCGRCAGVHFASDFLPLCVSHWLSDQCHPLSIGI